MVEIERGVGRRASGVGHRAI